MAQTTLPATATGRQWIQRRTLVMGGILVAIVAIVLFTWLLFQPSGKSGSPALLPVGQAAPTFALPDVKGQAVQLDQLRGHVVVLNFWSTTCGPCASETPMLQRTYQQYQGAGLIILGVAQSDPVTSINRFAGQYALTYPLLPDLDQAVNKRYQVTGLPVSYFLDKQGVIRYAVNGVLTPQTLKTGLQAAGLALQS